MKLVQDVDVVATLVPSHLNEIPRLVRSSHALLLMVLAPDLT